MTEVPESVWLDTVDTFRVCGRGRKECVVYWVGPAADYARVTRAVHPVHSATSQHYEVDGAWLTGFWVELADLDESVRVQVHTHRTLAGHSPTDDSGALVYQAGFLSLVLPWFATRTDPRHGAFLAELNHDGLWAEVSVDERLTWI